MTSLTGSEARELWKALMDNASALIADASLLFEAESFGRARSLKVLAQEELGKAIWIYDVFSTAWNEGDDAPRTVDRLAKDGRDHVQKYMEAFAYGDGLALFWGDYTGLIGRQRDGETPEDMWAREKQEAKEAARQANLQKQGGFYVDRDRSGTLLAPTRIEAGTIREDLALAGQVVEMMLIRDHTRMKHEATTPYDSTHPQQFRLLPISHPDDWANASEEFRNAGARMGIDEVP